MLALPGQALAHLQLDEARPGAGGVLQEAPGELRLTFSQPIQLTFTRVTLVGSEGRVPLDELDRPSENVVVAPIAGPLASGMYTVRWQTAGADGHPIRGEYTFTIEEGARGLAPPAQADTVTREAPAPAEPQAASPESWATFDAESPLYVAVRWLTFAALLGMIGAVAFRLLVLAPLCRKERPGSHGIAEPASIAAANVGLAASGILIVALVLRLYAQWHALGGGAPLAPILTGTLWGWGWLLQAAGTLAALTGLGLARRRRLLGWMLAAGAALTLAFTPSLSGHAAATQELTRLAVLADGLHVLGAGGWLGSLLLVVLVGLPVALRHADGGGGRAVAVLISAFSPTALFFAGLVVATGVFAAWLHLGSLAALWASTYGQTLLVKLGVFSVLFATGAYNWLRVKPALGDAAAASHLRRSAVVELVAAVLVLAVTAVLVATPPPAEMQAAAHGAPAPTATSVP